MPIIVCIPSYKPIKPSTIPTTTCQALPLPFSASVMLSTLLAIPLIAPQLCIKLLAVDWPVFSASFPALRIASAFAFQAAICWLISAASSIVAVSSWLFSIWIFVLISFSVLASAFQTGALFCDALPAFSIASAFAFPVRDLLIN